MQRWKVVELGMRAAVTEKTCVLQLSKINAAIECYCLDTFQAFKSELMLDSGKD